MMRLSGILLTGLMIAATAPALAAGGAAPTDAAPMVLAQADIVPGPPLGVVRAPRGNVPPAVLPPDRRAVGDAIAGALDNAPPDQPVSRPMPSASRFEIRVSPAFVRRTGAPCIGCRVPCRSYSYRYVRPDRGMVAVEGRRCRRPDGRWVPMGPDVIVAERAAVPGLARRSPPAAIPMPPEEAPYLARPNAPMAPMAPSAATRPPAPRGPLASGRPAPLPVPRPGDEQAGPDTLAAAPDAGAPADDEGPMQIDPAAPDEVAAATPQEAPSAVDGTASAGMGTDDTDMPAGTETDEPAPPAAAAPQPATPAAPAPDTDVAHAGTAPTAEAPRQVTPNGDGAPIDVETTPDPELVRLLRQLSYLDPASGAMPTPAEVQAAVGEFASDERFALPQPPAELKKRLEAAIDRLAALPSCPDGTTTGYGACLVDQ